jgi:predicted HAD superfamily Cof-like phosphohydrolase
MQKIMSDVRAFHEKFGQPYNRLPRELPRDLWDFRYNFLHEELSEYHSAMIHRDLEKQFDALIDLMYVAAGTAYLHGFRMPEGWDRVQAANMAKVAAKSADESRAASGRGSTYDIIKPPGWKPADLKDLL